VLAELLSRHLGNNDLKNVFPGFDVNPKIHLGLLKA
jgi:hypothetical protein